MTDEEIPQQGFIFGDAIYKNLKFLALVVLPAISTLYVTLGALWDLDYVTQVVGTISAVDTFLGIMLGISSKTYNASDMKYDGRMVGIAKEDGGITYSLELDEHPENIANMKSFHFKVVPPQNQ